MGVRDKAKVGEQAECTKLVCAFSAPHCEPALNAISRSHAPFLRLSGAEEQVKAGTAALRETSGKEKRSQVGIETRKQAAIDQH
jgi:hypothetical protein